MKAHLIKTTLLVTGLTLSACIILPAETWDTVTLNQQSVGNNSLDKLKVGDVVRAHYKEGSTHEFHVRELEPEAFIGDARDGKRYRVRYSALLQLEIRRTEFVEHDVRVPVPVSVRL